MITIEHWTLYIMNGEKTVYLTLATYLFLDDEETLIVAIRCLALLLIPGKTKSSDGDIPCFIRFVSVS